MINFINRKVELGYLENNFKELFGRKMFIIYGNMGFGKSELIKQFLCHYKDFPAIKVTIPQKVDVESGYYLKKIKEKSENPINFVTFKHTVNDYLLERNKIKLPIKTFFHIIEVIPVIKDLFQVFSKTYKYYCEEKNDLKNSFRKKELVLLEEYLQYLYNENPFILNIENIQSMDELSWNTLYNILCKTKDFSLIFEYTPDNDNINWSLSELESEKFSVLK